MTGPDAGGTRRPARFDQPPTPTGSITTITTARTPPSEAKRQPNAFTTSRGITRRRLPLVEEGLRMPAVTAAVGVSGAVVPAIEPGSTGALAPSEPTAGQVSTSLPLGPPQNPKTLRLRAGRFAVTGARGPLTARHPVVRSRRPDPGLATSQVRFPPECGGIHNED